MWFLAYLMPRRLKLALFAFFILSLVMTGIGYLLLRSPELQTEAAPIGQISLQFAWNEENASAMIDSWRDPATGPVRKEAYDNIHVDDYVYIPAYSTLTGLLCIWAGDKLRKKSNKYGKLGWRGRFTVVGTVFALTQTIAGGFDFAENRCIEAMLNGPVVDPLPMITTILSGIKWTLILIGLGFFFWGLYEAGFESTETALQEASSVSAASRTASSTTI